MFVSGPECRNDLIYKSKKAFYNATWKHSVCRSCAQIGHTPWNKGSTSDNDHRIKKASEALILSGNRKNKTPWNKGLSTETDPRVKLNVEKRTKTFVQRYKEGKITVWNKGKPFPQVAGENSPVKRPEVREKIAAKALARIGGDRGYKCAFNPKACELFDQINKEMNWQGLHALNNSKGEHRVFSTWFQVDFYEPRLNIVIEYYENNVHNRTKQKAKDLIRQKRIIEAINCHFYIIKQGEENLWRQIINKPFWLQVAQVSLDHTLLNIA